MEKDKILEQAQKENNGKDLADKQAVKDGTMIAYLIGVIGLIIVDMVNYFVLGLNNSGANFIICSMACSVFVVKFSRLKKKHELFTAIMWGAFALISLICWILQLCKVF